MAATTTTEPPQLGPDRSITEDKASELESLKEQPHSSKTETSVSPDPSRDAAVGHPRDSGVQLGSVASSGELTVYPPNIYAPQAQTFYYRGYENGAGEWDEYSHYLNPEGLEIGSPGLYNENPSLVFHSGYGYNPQMPYGPYSPVTTPLPSAGDAQMYSPQQFPYSGPPYYQQLGPHNMPYISSPTPVSQPELTALLGVDQQCDSMGFGPRPGGPFGRGSFPGNPGFHDLQQGFDGLRSGGIWSDWSKPSERQRPLNPFSPAVSPQPIDPVGSFGNVGMASQHQRSLYGYGSGSNSYSRGYFGQESNASYSNMGMGTRNWLSLDDGRRRVRGSVSLCSCNGPVDVLNEQNRGPRASKPKNLAMADGTSAENNKPNAAIAKVHGESCNHLDFLTDYSDAKFFIIKSYSEDNVHKSIKYGVWASTPNGNRKLDAAFREAKDSPEACLVFLLFSVNASAQFCGVAEMVGPVDFDKSVDYWQQDKWSGQFPVKWHIIKDVPNSQFRHIVLENNDNKPVTNSRDTQEVKLEQGIEMLKIFKNYETDMSILDDFEFYEDRQKAMQERKARQQASLIAVGAMNETDQRNPVVTPGGFIKQMSKSFAQVVRLDESTKEAPLGEKAGAAVEDSIAASPVTSSQTS